MAGAVQRRQGLLFAQVCLCNSSASAYVSPFGTWAAFREERFYFAFNSFFDFTGQLGGGG